MKKLIYLFCLVMLTWACKDDYYHDTGLSKGDLDMTMWEYFQTSSYNWDSTMLVIERANLKSYFTGEEISESITFLGITNHSIRKFMLDNGYEKVEDIPTEACEEYMKSYIILKPYLWDEIDYEVKGTTSNEGGIWVTNLNGDHLRLFRRKSDYGTVADAGPVSTFAQSLTVNKTVQAVSTNIRTSTGVVHALSYTHSFGPF